MSDSRRQYLIDDLPYVPQVFEITRESIGSPSGSSVADSYDTVLKIKHGHLTLEELVRVLESSLNKVVREMEALFRRRREMPVRVPRQDRDRFSGRGTELVQSIVHRLARTRRQFEHGLIILNVRYVDQRMGQHVYYYY